MNSSFILCLGHRCSGLKLYCCCAGHHGRIGRIFLAIESHPCLACFDAAAAGPNGEGMPTKALRGENLDWRTTDRSRQSRTSALGPFSPLIGWRFRNRHLESHFRLPASFQLRRT
jgi:hypothetical protein